MLRSLHLYDAKRNAPTKAGVLLFGRDVQGPFPSSAIKCACYPGTAKRKPSVDLELVEGDLFQMADQTIAFVNRHLSHGAGEHRHGAAADDVDEIPNSVIAEAVNNAIAHRNYASIGSIQVEVYSDRIEIISPGRLHRAISVADLYKKHESHAVNPRIARAMYQVKYIETMGTGLTDLLDACKANGLKRPLLEEVSSGFRIVIWRPERADNKGDSALKSTQKSSLKGSLKSTQKTLQKTPQKTPQKILAAICANPFVGTQEMADMIGVERSTVARAIAKLKRDGMLRRIGPDKGGHWEVVGTANE